MLYMQIGRETEAKSLFDAAFAADPFNVRADNMMKVLKHMASYTPRRDRALQRPGRPHAGHAPGQVHGALPRVDLRRADRAVRLRAAGPTKIEIMKNHQWFSGRTIGLPFIPTVGACTGKVVALASPRATNKPFNWARVLKHEVVHVITLQQTEFNIPHWYTEALAVESEGFPRPQEWNKLLLERVPDAVQAPEPRHDQPRLHPPQGARRPPDGLLPGAALRPLHAQAVRRRRPDQDARWPTAAA